MTEIATIDWFGRWETSVFSENIAIFYYVIAILNRTEKDGENTDLVVKSKHENGLKINLECEVITFSHRFSVFNICCCPQFALGINISLGRHQTLTPQTCD